MKKEKKDRPTMAAHKTESGAASDSGSTREADISREAVSAAGSCTREAVSAGSCAPSEATEPAVAAELERALPPAPMEAIEPIPPIPEPELPSPLLELFKLFPLTQEAISEHEADYDAEALRPFVTLVAGYARGSGKALPEIDRAIAGIFSLAQAVRGGSLDLDMLELMMRGQCHDRDLEAAVREAELRGRNAAIEARIREEEASDGLPHLGSGSTRSDSRSRGLFSLADTAR